MNLVLEINSGPREGERVPVREGLQIGRKAGDILLADPKISSRHCHIERTDSGEWCLIDDGSSNGIRVQGRKVPKLILRAGTQFVLGNTAFTVQGVLNTTQAAPGTSFGSTPDLGAPPTIELAPELPKDWRARLIDWLDEKIPKVNNSLKPLTAFRPAMELNFLQGPQVKTRWLIGYGPRKIGSKSFEFPIFEENAPGTCFELIPKTKGVNFKTGHPDVVLVNGENVENVELKDGDIIQIMHTKIEIGFRK